MSRDQLIQLLVIDALEHAGDIGRYRWLARGLENGFPGFATMSDGELAEEARLRNIDSVSETLSYQDSIESAEDEDPDLPQLLARYTIDNHRLDLL